MDGLVIHRLARTRYAGSMQSHLSPGETISQPEIRAERRAGGGWVEATPELIEEGSVAVTSGFVTVAFTKKRAASESEQPAGQWRITAIATSSDQEVVVGWMPVEVVG